MKKFFLIFIFFNFLKILFAKDYFYPYQEYKDRDPFRPLVGENGELFIQEEKKNSLDLVLQGIIYQRENSLVIINGGTFRENDLVNDYKIKKIEKDYIVLEKDNIEYILKWEER